MQLPAILEFDFRLHLDHNVSFTFKCIYGDFNSNSSHSFFVDEVKHGNYVSVYMIKYSLQLLSMNKVLHYGIVEFVKLLTENLS